MTTAEVITTINLKRKKKGLDPLPYQTFMNHYRIIKKLVPPAGKKKTSFLFDKKTSRKIVLILWDQNYRKTPRVDWFAWRRKVA